MKKTIFLLLLLTSFTMMFGQTRNVQIYVVDANGSRVTGAADGISLTNTTTSAITLATMNNGSAFIAALTVGDTYNYDITPPVCYTNQTHSTGSFVVEAATDIAVPTQRVDATPFEGSEVTSTVSVTVNVDGAPATETTVAKLYRFPSGSNNVSYLEIIGTNTAGVYSFANVPFGAWNLSVQAPCARTQRYTNATTITCNNYDGPITISTKNINTTPGSYNVYTGPSATGLKLLSCTEAYPIGVSGGNIIDNTQYTVNYTYDNWGTPTTVTSPVVTSFPTFNSPPFSNNNNNRLQFSAEGYNGSLVTVNYLTQVGGSCPDLVIDKSTTNLGIPKAFVSFTDTSLGWQDPSSIVSATMTNDETGEEFTDYAFSDTYGAFGFANISEGNYTAKLNLTNCRVGYEIAVNVTCESILANANTYTFDGSTVPVATSGKVVARMVATPSGDTCPLPVFDAAVTATMTDGVNVVTGTLTFDNDFVFENVPFSETPYTITAVRPCFPDVTATYTVNCASTWYSVRTDTGDPCYRTATETGYGYTTLDYTGLSSSVASDFTVVMDMPIGEAYFSSAALSGSGGYIEGNTSLGNFATFSNIPYGTYTLYLDRDCYNQKVIEGIEISCATLTAAAADPENPFGTPYELVTYTSEDAKTTNTVVIAPMFEAAILADATVTLSSVTADYSSTTITSAGWLGTDPAYFFEVPYATDYTYTITYPCYDTQEGTLTVDCNDNVEIIMEVEMSVATTNDLVVYVAPPGGFGIPTPGVTIRVWNDDLSYDETIPSSGYNLFSGVPYGTVNYSLSKNCYVTATGTTTIECTPDDIAAVAVEFGVKLTTNDLYVNLGPVGGIGFGVFGATIRVYNDDLSYDETIESSSDLNLFANLPYGDYNYVITQTCKETVTGTTTVDCNDGDADGVFVEFGVNQTTNDLYVNLGPVGGIGFGVFGATIRVYNADFSYDETIESSSDLNLFANVPYGDVTYVVTQDCKETVTGTTTVDCNEGDADGVFVEFGVASTTNDLVVYVAPPGGFGFPTSGVTIRVWNDDLSYDETITSSGYNLFSAVPYGTVNYSLSKDCYVTATGTTTVECTPGDIDAVAVEFGVKLTSGQLDVAVSDGMLPLFGATVRIYNAELNYDETQTTADFTSFTDVPYGDYAYEVSYTCKETAYGTVTIACNPDNFTFLSVELNPATKNILTLMIDNGTDPVNGVEVTISNEDGYSDSRFGVQGGMANFFNVPYGTITYSISGGDCLSPKTGTVTVDCNNGEAVSATVSLDASTIGDLIVSVTDGTEELIGATIRIYNAELNYDETVISSGYNIFKDVPYGDFAYEISYTCKETAYGTVTMACSQYNLTFLDVVLNPATKNMLTLMIDNGTDPVNGAEVTISNEDGYSDTRFGVQGGMANFFNVPYGTITYSITGGDCVSPKTGTVTVDCNNGEAVSATVSLDASTIGNLNLSVTDGTEEISGATIHIFNTEASYDVTATSSGYNYFTDVPYGELSYEVSMEGKKTAMGTITIACAQYNITEFQVVLEPALGVNDFNKNSFNAVSFPNPFVDNFAVKVTSLNQDKVNIKVYDMTGRLLEQRNTNVSDLETTQIGKNYPSGIYNVVVSQDQNVKTLRVIKR